MKKFIKKTIPLLLTITLLLPTTLKPITEEEEEENVKNKIIESLALIEQTKEDAQKDFYKIKRIVYLAKDEAKKRTDDANNFVKEVENASNQAEAEFEKIKQAYQDAKNAKKKLAEDLAAQAVKTAQAAAQNTKEAVYKAQDALFRILKIKEKTL